MTLHLFVVDASRNRMQGGDGSSMDNMEGRAVCAPSVDESVSTIYFLCIRNEVNKFRTPTRLLARRGQQNGSERVLNVLNAYVDGDLVASAVQ